LKVALVHEFLITWGGSDLVVQKFHEIFPDAPIFTALFDKNQIGDRFKNAEIVTSFLQKLPFSIKKHRFFMPLFPMAFESFDMRDYDVVLSSHHCSAKSVITPAGTCHVCFVHSPMRYAWDFFPEYMAEFGRLMQIPMRLLFHYMRMHDVAAASRVDYYIANSENVRKRIMKHYRRDSVVINSPVQASRFHISKSVGDYYLVVSRLVPYKRVDIAVEAFSRLKNEKLLVVGNGPEMNRLKKIAGTNVEFVGFAPDEQLAEYYSKCKAFLFPGEEDFGITPLEAMASGRPVVAYSAGGALETVSDGITGVFFDHQHPESLSKAISKFDPDSFDPEKIRAHAETFDESVYKRKIKEFVDSKHAEWRDGCVL